MVEAIIILALLLLALLVCFLGGRLHVLLLYLTLGLKFTSIFLSTASRYWRFIAATFASLTVMFVLFAAYGFGLEALHPLNPLTPLLVYASWLLHGSSTTFDFAGAVWLLHGLLHPAFIASPSLLTGLAVWTFLHGKRRLSGVLASSSLILVAAPYAAHRVAVFPSSQLTIPPSAILAVAACSAAALSAFLIAHVYFGRKAVCESFYASYVSHPTSGGKVAGGVAEEGSVRVVMLAVADGGRVHVLVSGCFREEFEDRAKHLGGVEGVRVTVSQEVKKAWRRYLLGGDPQPAVNLLLKMLESREQG